MVTSIICNGKNYDCTAAHIRSVFPGSLETLTHAEIWLTTANGDRFCVMLNARLAFLMYLPPNNDCGMRSDNPDGDESTFADFRLANGQTDSYPGNWLLPRDSGIAALYYVIENGKPDPQINWVES